MSIFRREKTNFFGKAKKTKTLAEPHQKNKWIITAPESLPLMKTMGYAKVHQERKKFAFTLPAENFC
jgi:hypothetical protein